MTAKAVQKTQGTTKMEATPYQENPRKKQRIEEDYPNGVNHEEPQSTPQPEDPQGMALSNQLVLKNIFSFLSPVDLESCRNECTLWRGVANCKPLNFFHCDIEIQTNQGCKPIINKLTKKSRKNSLRQKRSKYSRFEGAIKTLEEAPSTLTLVLSLIVDFKIDVQDDRVEYFISEFGHFVQHMDFVRWQTLPLNVFCEFLLKFPNLRSLKCSAIKLTEDPENSVFNPELLNNHHLKLKKINIGMCQQSPAETLWKLLKIAPNLEEIENLPIWLINAIEMAEKGHAVRSVAYHYTELEQFSQNGVTVLSAFEKLAQLKPKLSSFSFLPSESSLEEDTTIEKIKPHVLSILQSSAESLRSFHLGLAKSFEFQEMVQFEQVKTLVFLANFDKRSCFLGEISLSEIFPNVDEVQFLFTMDQNSIHGILPAGGNSFWGSQIKRLHVLHLHRRTLQLLGSTFPLIEDLTFAGSAWDLEQHLPVMAELWPRLKSMTVILTNGSDVRQSRRGNFDCAFTGISREVIIQLYEPLEREFSAAQIERFKEESTIAKFKELQQLTLTRNGNFKLKNPTKVYQTLTSLTNEFGFELLPHLEVFVGVMMDRSWKAINSTLMPLVMDSNVEILELYPK